MEVHTNSDIIRKIISHKLDFHFVKARWKYLLKNTLNKFIYENNYDSLTYWIFTMLINLLINNEEVDTASFYCYRQYAMVFVLTIMEAYTVLLSGTMTYLEHIVVEYYAICHTMMISPRMCLRGINSGLITDQNNKVVQALPHLMRPDWLPSFSIINRRFYKRKYSK